MESLALKITYDAFQWNKGVEDLNSIEEFKTSVGKSYASIVKANPVGRGGGAYQFIIDFFVNLTAKEYLSAVGGYLAGKAIDRLTDPALDRYIFTPLKDAYKNLKAKNPILDCHSFTLELLDTKIFLYSTAPDSIIDNKNAILLALNNNIESLIQEEEFPGEIHIPVYEERIGPKLVYRPPLGIDEVLDTSNNNNFFKLWGLKYLYSYKSLVYDVVNKQSLLDTEFLTEAELEWYRQNS